MPIDIDTSLVLSFGIFSLIATLAALHYRDSLCCLCCRTRSCEHGINVRSRPMQDFFTNSAQGSEIDVEAAAGTQNSPTFSPPTNQPAVIELQPHPTFPLYFDINISGSSTRDLSPGIVSGVTATDTS